MINFNLSPPAHTHTLSHSAENSPLQCRDPELSSPLEVSRKKKVRKTEHFCELMMLEESTNQNSNTGDLKVWRGGGVLSGASWINQISPIFYCVICGGKKNNDSSARLHLQLWHRFGVGSAFRYGVWRFWTFVSHFQSQFQDRYTPCPVAKLHFCIQERLHFHIHLQLTSNVTNKSLVWS